MADLARSSPTSPQVRIDAGTSNSIVDCPADRGEGCVIDAAATCDMFDSGGLGGDWMVMVSDVRDGATLSTTGFSPPPPPQFDANLDLLLALATADLPMILGPPTELWCEQRAAKLRAMVGLGRAYFEEALGLPFELECRRRHSSGPAVHRR